MQQQHRISPPEEVRTTVHLPASKSISNRALILNALSLSSTPIHNLSDCEDTRVIIDSFNSNSNLFDVKGAGTAMRFLTAFLAGMEGEWIIRGSKRMHERPIHPLVETLNVLGAEIDYLEKEGFPPLRSQAQGRRGLRGREHQFSIHLRTVDGSSYDGKRAGDEHRETGDFKALHRPHHWHDERFRGTHQMGG